VEAKVRKEVEKRRIVEKKKKKKMLEYLQQLWDEVLVEDTAFLEGAEGSKHKEITLEDDRNYKSFKKTKKKQPARYCRDIRVKMEDVNPCERCMCVR